MSTEVEYDQQTRQCIDTCAECHDVCSKTVVYSIEHGSELANSTRLKRILDCIDMCQTTHKLMLRQSTFHRSACKVCAEVCAACADSCESVAMDDEQIKRCADVCRRCASTCSTMAP